jgi:homoserine kinase
MIRTVQAVVPGSTGNLGPGFDLFGLAVDIYVRLTVTVEGTFVMASTAEPEWVVEWDGEGSGPPAPVPLDRQNLAVCGLESAWSAAGLAFDGRVNVSGSSEIPVARGLGASAASLVAGLLAGDSLADASLDPERLLELATAEEGHSDNAAPSIMGGLIAAAPLEGRGVLTHRSRLFEDYLLGAVVPEMTLSTRLAREALPGEIAHQDAVKNQQRSFFLFHALVEGRTDELKELVEDSLHQPYRARLIPCFEELMALAWSGGADAVWLSGSGPTLLVLVEGSVDRVEGICRPLEERWAAEGISSRTLVLGPDDLGGAVHDVG